MMHWKRLSPKNTKVIVPVDLGGIPCDYDRIYEIVERKEEPLHPSNKIQEAIVMWSLWQMLPIAFGASYHGKMVGALADFTNYSFHAVKKLHHSRRWSYDVEVHSRI
jgi:dTDP-4-amino-4,6-dideoxygalactose transaminase